MALQTDTNRKYAFQLFTSCTTITDKMDNDEKFKRLTFDHSCSIFYVLERSELEAKRKQKRNTRAAETTYEQTLPPTLSTTEKLTPLHPSLQIRSFENRCVQFSRLLIRLDVFFSRPFFSFHSYWKLSRYQHKALNKWHNRHLLDVMKWKEKKRKEKKWQIRFLFIVHLVDDSHSSNWDIRIPLVLFFFPLPTNTTGIHVYLQHTSVA